MKKPNKVTLRDVLHLMWDVTELDLDVREDYKLVCKYLISEDATEKLTVHQRHDVADGKLIAVDAKINAYGDVKRNGMSEMGWGVEESRVTPPELLDMEVTSMRQTPRCGTNKGSCLNAHLERGDYQIGLEL